MEKPSKKSYEYLPYGKCAEYIAHVLGVKDLREVDGKFYGNKDAEYKDFWHLLVDKKTVHNGCVITIYLEDADGAEDWQRQIIEAFVTEFGEGAEYWVDW